MVVTEVGRICFEMGEKSQTMQMWVVSTSWKRQEKKGSSPKASRKKGSLALCVPRWGPAGEDQVERRP